MKKEYELSALGIGALIAGVLSIVVAEIAIFSTNRTLQTVMLVKVFLTTFNIVLLLGLTANYFKIYSGMKTPLSRSLLMFSTALMLYAVTSSPLTHVIMGFEIISIGPFTFIPDIFVTLATVIILRESYR